MTEQQNQPSWRPLSRIERRIVGVLVEKAKTPPDQYPLSLNALVNGCNQKSNRDPQMNLQEGQVEDALVDLRQISAVGEVQGGSRVAKYRHYMKEWLNVAGPELAVMAELLLRGDQTIGELRGRANRMTSNEIPDVSSLRPVLDSLIQKKLVVPLTPPGRGQVVTHGLYKPDELAALQQKHGGGDFSTTANPAPQSPSPSPPLSDTSWSADDAPATGQPSAPSVSSSVAASPASSNAQDGDGSLRDEVRQLREEVARLKKEVEDLWANLS
mgnify:FL=1